MPAYLAHESSSPTHRQPASSLLNQLSRTPDLDGRLLLVCSYAFNMASRLERFEGRLVPWMFRILGPRLIGQVHHWNAA
jgi:hypothetical protein